MYPTSPYKLNAFFISIVQTVCQEHLVVTDGYFFLEVLDECDTDLRRLVASQSIRSIRDELHFNAYLNLCESMNTCVVSLSRNATRDLERTAQNTTEDVAEPQPALDRLFREFYKLSQRVLV